MGCLRNKYTILAALNAFVISFVLGTCIGWTSPVMPKLTNHSEDSPLEMGITTSEEGWISSIITLGALISSFLTGPISGWIGRKASLLFSSMCIGTSYVILALLRTIWLIYLARFIQGIAAAFIFTALPMYVGETATDDYRGPLSSLMTVFMMLGILYAYIIGPYVNYVVLQWCCLSTCIFFLVSFYFMPESPYFYVIKNRRRDAMKSLEFLRDQNGNEIDDELNRIHASVDEEMSRKGTLLEILTVGGYRKALMICCGLSSFQQLSGTSVVTAYSQSIFSSTRTIDPAIATIILGVVQLGANLLTLLLINRIGRRLILFISAAGMSLTLFALGAYFWLQAYGDVSAVLWLPVSALISFNVMYSFGFGPIPYVVLSEIFPLNIKPIALSIVSGVMWVSSFVVVRWFPELNALGPYYAFWIFGSLCCLACSFVLVIVMETKGLSLQQIQQKLHR